MRNWLITLRNEQGMSAQDVAQKLNITPAYYSMIENGKRQRKMDITLIAQLATIFGKSIAEIAGYEEAC